MEDPTTRTFDAGGITDTDPDLLVDDVESPTVMDALREELSADVTVESKTYDVPGRPGYAVRFDPSIINYDRLVAWGKRARDKDIPGGVHLLRSASIVLANACECIQREGEDLGVDGEPYTFASKPLKQLLGVDRAVQAVQKFYGRDGDVIRTAQLLVEAAGFSRDDLDLITDPTTD